MPGPGDYEVAHHKSIDASIRNNAASTYGLGFYRKKSDSNSGEESFR
jgi:hypothetical protein